MPLDMGRGFWVAMIAFVILLAAIGVALVIHALIKRRKR